MANLFAAVNYSVVYIYIILSQMLILMFVSNMQINRIVTICNFSH